MQSGIFSTLFYKPLYNALAFLIGIVPGGNVGIAIIILTLAVRTIIAPLSYRSVVSQAKMRALNPHIEKVKEDHKHDKQEQARKVMELYQKHGVNPFSGCLLVLIQLPIILALYFVFFKGLPGLKPELLYSFVGLPEHLNMTFLGILLSGKSLVLALTAAATQYVQINLSMPALPPQDKNSKPTFKDDFARSFNTQMRFMLPLIVFGVSYTISAAIALYWTTTNLFSIAQELYVKRKAETLVK